MLVQIPDECISRLARETWFEFLCHTEHGAKAIDIHVRKDGRTKVFQADFLKYAVSINEATGIQQSRLKMMGAVIPSGRTGCPYPQGLGRLTPSRLGYIRCTIRRIYDRILPLLRRTGL